MTDSFVYRWRNKKTRQWYIGYHKGRDDDGYICSSKSALGEIQENPDTWQRKILRRGTKQAMIELEHRLLKRLNARANPLSLNRSNGWPRGGYQDWQVHVVKVHDRHWAIEPELLKIVREVTGQSYYRYLLQDFFLSYRQRDLALVREYIPIILVLFGVELAVV